MHDLPVPDVLSAARELVPEFTARAAEAEQLRTMPPDLVAKVEAAGLFAMWLPRSLGGIEVDPPTIVRVVEELSYADGSAGWTVLIGTATGFFAWLEPDVARDLLGGTSFGASTCVVAPNGTAAPHGSGFTVSGRWPFNSGIRHARFSQVAAVVMANGAPRLLPDGTPEWRFAFVRTAAGRVIDTWDTAGMRGTGSDDFALDAALVPDELFVNTITTVSRHDGPTSRIPLFANLNITIIGWPLGVARRALDEFAAMARTKVRGMDRVRMADDRQVQLQLASAEGGLQSARAFAFDVIGELWDTARAGDPLSLDQRARLSLATQQAMRASVAAVDAVYRLAGAGAVYSDQPLQRCFRDIHTIDAHTFVSPDVVTRYAKHVLGVPQAEFLL